MNQVFDRKTGHSRKAIDDAKSEVLGRKGRFAAASLLQVDTVADALKKATSGKAKAVSISHKDRAAIIPGGKQPDLVLWYDSVLFGFTSSKYYVNKLPNWLQNWQKAHPISEMLTTWEPHDKKRLETLLGPDDAPGEGNYQGFGATFPHLLNKTDNPAYTFLLAPQSTEYMLMLAREVVKQMELGRDEIPDLLAISISGTDYAGHIFGPDSWEYIDHLIRADAKVGEFLRDLSKQTTVSWLLTSDHGVAPLPEKLKAQKALRIYPDDLVQQTDSHMDAELGDGNWLTAYHTPFIYLSNEAHDRPDKSAIISRACEILEDHPCIKAAYDTTLLVGKEHSLDPLERAAALSTYKETMGDIFVVPDENCITDINMVRGMGTTHGTPFSYDREVPVFVVAKQVKPNTSFETFDQRRIAPTLSRLLNIPPPQTARMPPLPGM